MTTLLIYFVPALLDFVRVRFRAWLCRLPRRWSLGRNESGLETEQNGGLQTEVVSASLDQTAVPVEQ
jgi:hypothetical protein